jgi:hypothetical protein
MKTEVFSNWHQLHMHDGKMIKLNGNQALLLRHMYNKGGFSTRDELCTLLDGKIIGTRDQIDFDFANIFKSDTKQRSLVHIKPGRAGLYDVSEYLKRHPIVDRSVHEESVEECRRL